MLGFSACIVNHIGSAGQNIPPLGTNYKIISVANGSAATTRFLGIGSKDRLTADAMQNMVMRYPLSKGQTYAFLNTDSRNGFFGFLFTQTNINISAYIIELSDTMQSAKNMVDIFNRQDRYVNYDRFAIGSRVYFIENERIVEGFLKSYTPRGGALVVYVSASKIWEMEMPLEQLFPNTITALSAMKASTTTKAVAIVDSILRAQESAFIEDQRKMKENLAKSGQFSEGDKVYFETTKGKTLGVVVKVEGDFVHIKYEESKTTTKVVVVSRAKVVLANN